MQINSLDNFRSRYGFEAINTIVRVVSQSIRNIVREEDFLGRWTDDVFFVVMAECGPTQLLRMADRIKQTVAGAEVRWWGDRLPVTVSFGATLAEQEDSLEALIERVESSLRKTWNVGEKSLVFHESSGGAKE